MAAALEGGIQEDLDDFPRVFQADEPARYDDYVRVVVGARQLGDVRPPAEGGAYALILSGLNPGKVKFTVANVPAMCEHTAYKDGRSPGWPLLIDNTPEGTEKMAPYFDVVNFAARVDNPVCVGVGFIDVACGPSSVYAAFNKIKAPKKIYPLYKIY